MDDARNLQRDHEALLERFQATDRERARKRMHIDPGSLSDYECKILGAEYRAFVRRRDEAETTVREATAALTPPGIRFRNDLLRRLNKHAIDLVIRHGLTVTRSRHGGGWARTETKTICVPAVTSEEHYAVCLHEIGHAVSPEADSRQYASWIEDNSLHAAGGELGAWRWAVKHALVWTREMQERLYGSFRDHPAYRAATIDERRGMAGLLTTAALRIADKPWTFGELETKRASIERPGA